MNNITLIPIKCRIIKPNEDIIPILDESLNKNKINLEKKDILVIAENAIATAEGNLVKLGSINPSNEAIELAKKHDMDPNHVQVILNESQKIYGGVSGALLALKDNMICANAGVDSSNVPEGYVSLLPKNAKKTAEKIRSELKKRFKVDIGVVISDSRVYPLRRGTVGFAIATSGIVELIDDRGKKDIYGKEMKITMRAIADSLSSTAQLLMGETNELIPFVLIRGLDLHSNSQNETHLNLDATECLFMNNFLKG